MLASTWRIRTVGEIQCNEAVVAFWHGTMLPCWKFFSGKQANAVTSLSKDGDVLAQLLNGWKYNVLRGSSSKGGAELLDEMTVKARTSLVLVTPDGPRGPNHKFKAGAVVAAQRAGVPLVLCNIKVFWRITLNSWDRFEIPMPFTKIIIEFLPPVFVSKEADRKEIAEIMEYSDQVLDS